MYRRIFDAALTRTDPERIHHLAHAGIGALGHLPILPRAIGEAARGPGHVRVMGIDFPGRLGLAAGFDKDASAVLGLLALGFAFVEVGTITAQGQPGNERPRLWRHTQTDSLRNRMGFNNPGALAAARSLRSLRRTPAGRAAIVGVNIGKSKVTRPELAEYDYATSARLLAPSADYLVVNVSSPNTPGLRDLQSVELLRPILHATRTAADAARGSDRRLPLLVKIAPDLADGDVDAVCDLACEIGLDGIVAVNTTIAHSLGAGGLSGPPLRGRGIELVKRIRKRAGDRLAIMGVGGIVTPGDARAYLEAGADLLQAYTALIYQGPAWPGRINRALAHGAARPTDPHEVTS